MTLRRVAVTLVGCALAVSAEPAFAATPAVYADAGRDAATGAPEITTVVVSNDDAGTIRFRINVANQERIARDATLSLYLDTDMNATTGDALSLGAEYTLYVDGASRSFGFGRWDGTRFVEAPASSVQVRDWSGLSIWVNRSELGGTGAFLFWIRAGGPGSAADTAPDRGAWSYQLGTGGVNPADISGVYYSTRPGIVRAGGTWQLRVESIRLLGSTAVVPPERWSCAATVGGRPLRGSGEGGCTFRIPKSARGKKLVVTVTVTYMGQVVNGAVTRTIR